ncbi:hypothetical protein LMH87_004327 [Akanthomyces muscarius]|uniref:Uncharacterized protein n=1 Tax=Akanthomyces muscarius TaxID=2231603 RepID=A0A9W8Q332_AKAMU|nr:hypothetical protein LMH87_004327 [Akanthomyces muscarius]KAJ4145478.1 hypothetical protein LMH87_004327 [Akanthomyces muscarius]
MIRRILNILKDSGIDHKGESLLISWPYGRDVYQCLEINLSQQESYWARILADSEDCATFAYASPHCLETEEYRCRKAELSCSWRSTILLLETAVTISVGHEGVAPQPAVGKLVHQGRYYFKSFGSVHMVKAEQPDPTAVAKLVRKKNLVPDKMKHRLYGRTQLTKRIRERSRMQDVGESVAWLTSSI